MPRSRPIHSPERCAWQPGRTRWLAGAAAALIATAASILASACGPRAEVEAPPPAAAPRGQRLQFEYVTIDGKPLSTQTLSGRISVIGFVATYDVASQAQARFLADLLHHHKPRLNVALLVLEAPENKPLVQAFAATLSLPYPVALADAATIAGEGPFKGLHHVPSVVVLDREGREAWRNLGITEEKVLEEAVQDVERGEPAPLAAPPP